MARTEARSGPDFFLAGAPKCGTTALYSYLREHPNVFMARPKEPNYFCTDLDVRPQIATEREYRALFEDATDAHTAIGEASVWYSYSRVAADRIRAFRPDAKIIVLLRDPISLLRSLHGQLCFVGWESESDFSRAWRLQGRRSEGADIPPGCPDPRVLQYADMGRLGEQLSRWLTTFSPELVRPILFEDFVDRTAEVYADVLDFVGVPYDGRSEFPRVNASRTHRVKWLGRLLHQPPPPVRAIGRRARRGLAAIGVDEQRFFKRLVRLNARPQPRAPIPPGLHEELAETFRPDVIALSDLLGRDLEGWLEPRTPEAPTS